jgi:hypothetical protein
MFTRARDHWLMSNRSAGNERSALRSRDANTLARDPSRLPERSLVQPFEQFPDRAVHFFQSEKLLMT